MEEKLMTTKEVAKRCDISERTLKNWRKAGKGPKWIELSKDVFRYHPDDIRAYEDDKATGASK